MKITKIRGGKEESVVRQELSLQRRKEREESKHAMENKLLFKPTQTSKNVFFFVEK